MRRWLLNRIYAAVATPAEASGGSASGSKVSVEVLESRMHLSVTPNDPSYAQEWGMRASSAGTAWSVTTGSTSVVVADIDSGIDYTHQDLYKNIWINQAEIPAAVKATVKDADQDGRITFYDLNSSINAGKVGASDSNHNGYIDAADLLKPYKSDGGGGWEDGINGKSNANDKYTDDICGWDFADNDNHPFDYYGHGTHTAGTIGAVGNNGAGVAGVAWKVRLMAVKIFHNNGDGVPDSSIAAAIRYSADNGAKVSNNSYGGYDGQTGDTLYQAISYAKDKGQLTIFAAGNDSADNDKSEWASYPASYDLPNIVSVAATDSSGTKLAWFSNTGHKSVDLAAPGDNIVSTWTGGGYAKVSGTSMAAPHVAGAVALILSKYPDLSYAQLKTALINGVDHFSTLTSSTVSGGRLDIAKAIAQASGMRASAVHATSVSSASTSASVTHIAAASLPATKAAVSSIAVSSDDSHTDRKIRRHGYLLEIMA